MSSIEVVQTAEPVHITAPPDFPVVWKHPDDARMFWQPERLHFADPMTPMDYAFMAVAHDQLNWAFEQYGLPIRYHYRLFNHRWFYTIAPVDAPPEQLRAMDERGAANVTAASDRLQTLWNDEWLPEVRQHLAFWEVFDLAGADVARLLAHFDETVARIRRCWQIHFLQTLPVYVAMSSLEELCRDLFGDESALRPYRLTQGLGNATFESGCALWRLSQRALAVPLVRRILEERGAGEVLTALEATAVGRAFLGELRAYLDLWGKRGDKMGISYPSWIEDPLPVIKQLKDYVARPDRDIEAEFAGLAEARERAVAEARGRLSGYPAAVRDQFERALRAAQFATVISEDHNYLIDFQCNYEVRRVLLGVGARLAAFGALDAQGDVFYFSPDELWMTAAALPAIDQRKVVAERRASIARAGLVMAPRALGTVPDGPPPDDPVALAVGKFFGAPPPPTTQPGVLRGHPGSPGRAHGPAKVIRSLAEAAKLRPGDVLVAESTAPSWTPLFATVAAVVTDTGGVLSHCAVVAREYGLPAVVGTATATELIRDGQIVEVDGDAGLVRIGSA
jgi:phosphohistidine swiveling domain-containing protein